MDMLLRDRTGASTSDSPAADRLLMDHLLKVIGDWERQLQIYEKLHMS